MDEVNKLIQGLDKKLNNVDGKLNKETQDKIKNMKTKS
jgi:hypothetical protein